MLQQTLQAKPISETTNLGHEATGEALTSEEVEEEVDLNQHARYVTR